MKTLKILNDAWIISNMRILAIRRYLFSYLVVSMLTPIGITIMISFAAGITESAKINYIIGAIVFSLSMAGVNGVGQDIAQDRLLGTLKWFITSPIHPVSYTLGLLIPHVIAGLLNTTLILLLGKYVWGAPIVLSPILPLIFVMSILSLLGVGAVIGSYSKVPAQAYGLTNVISFVIILLSPVYYLIDALPLFLRPVAYIFPTTYAAQALRAVLSGSFEHVLENIVALTLITTTLLTIGLSKIKWRETS